MIARFNDMTLGEDGYRTCIEERYKIRNPFAKFKIIDDLVCFEINEIKDLYFCPIPLTNLSNMENLLEKFIDEFRNKYGIDVVYVDNVDIDLYVKDDLCFYSNGGVTCIFNKNNIIEIHVSRENLITTADPSSYAQDMMTTADYIKRFIEYEDGDYYFYELQEDFAHNIQNGIKDYSKKILIEKRYSQSTKSSRKIEN